MAENDAKKPDDDECVSQLELRDMMRTMTDAFNKYKDATTSSFERLDRRIFGLVDRMDTMETRLPQATATAANDDEVDDTLANSVAPRHRRLDRNR
jgi:hypothetical protein